MLLRHRPPSIDAAAPSPRPGFEHLDSNALAVLRWLGANRVDFIVVGPVARAIRGDTEAAGPVSIVLAPYVRNYERLTRALVGERAGLRAEHATDDGARAAPVSIKLTPDKLSRGRRWMLRFGQYDLDLEGAGPRTGTARPPDVAAAPATSGPRYQELLYEANRFELAEGISVEVASPEDLEHFSHVRRTGTAPEFRVTRSAGVPPAGAAS